MGFAPFFFVEGFFPFSVFRIVLGLVVAMIGIRMAGRFTLLAGPEGVEWRTTAKTRRWPYSSIDHFELARRSGESAGTQAQILRIHLTDGRAQWLVGVDGRRRHSSWFGSSERGPSLEHVVSELNRIVAESRSRQVERQAG